MTGGTRLVPTEQGREDGCAQGVVERATRLLGHVALRGAQPHLNDERHAEGDACRDERRGVPRRGGVDHVAHEQGVRDGDDGHGALEHAQARDAPRAVPERGADPGPQLADGAVGLDEGPAGTPAARSARALAGFGSADRSGEPASPAHRLPLSLRPSQPFARLARCLAGAVATQRRT